MDLFAYVDRTEPSSPTSTTPASSATSLLSSGPLRLGPQSQPQSRAQLKQLGRRVYKDVWTEFYDWEPGYCTEILGTVRDQSFLASDARQLARVAKAMVTALLDDVAPKTETDVEMADTVNVSITTVRQVANTAASGAGQLHGARGRIVTVMTRKEVAIPVITIDTTAFPPHPRYESCPPASRSVQMETIFEYTLPFLPYADDERFKAMAFQARFDILEWEQPFDPDGGFDISCIYHP